MCNAFFYVRSLCGKRFAVQRPLVCKCGTEQCQCNKTCCGLDDEKIGVAIGIDESSSRSRISRYELGVHEPPVPTTKLIAGTLGVPLAYMYCEDDNVAALLLALYKLKPAARERKIGEFMGQLG